MLATPGSGPAELLNLESTISAERGGAAVDGVGVVVGGGVSVVGGAKV